MLEKSGLNPAQKPSERTQFYLYRLCRPEAQDEAV